MADRFVNPNVFVVLVEETIEFLRSIGASLTESDIVRNVVEVANYALDHQAEFVGGNVGAAYSFPYLIDRVRGELGRPPLSLKQVMLEAKDWHKDPRPRYNFAAYRNRIAPPGHIGSRPVFGPPNRPSPGPRPPSSRGGSADPLFFRDWHDYGVDGGEMTLVGETRGFHHPKGPFGPGYYITRGGDRQDFVFKPSVNSEGRTIWVKEWSTPNPAFKKWAIENNQPKESYGRFTLPNSIGPLRTKRKATREIRKSYPYRKLRK